MKRFCLLLLLAATLCVVAQGQETCTLWTGPALPRVLDLPFVDVVTHVQVCNAVEGEFQFLHGPAIIAHHGVLYACWGNSPIDENSSQETIRGASSTDGGLTWSKPFFIGDDLPGDLARSHGSFAIQNDQLWALALHYRYPIFENKQVQAEGFTLDETTGQWQSQGVVAEVGAPVDAPRRMLDGRWIAGSADINFCAGVLLSRDDTLRHFDFISIPTAEGDKFSETSVVVDGKRITAFMRNEKALGCGVSFSEDGRTWTTARESNFPIARSKVYAGILSTDQLFMICNMTDGKPMNRDTLVVAVSKPGERTFSYAWKIRQGLTRQPLLRGMHKMPGWQYPYAYEHDGKLYVIYSVGKEDCELSIIPVRCLQIPADASYPQAPQTADTKNWDELPDLLAADEFDYPAGQPLDRVEATGTGFVKRWNRVRHQFTTIDGGAVEGSGNESSAQVMRMFDGWSIDFDAEGRTCYFSAKVSKVTRGTNNAYLHIQLVDAGEAGVMVFGVGSNDLTQVGVAQPTTKVDNGEPVQVSDWTLLAGKLVTHASAPDELYLTKALPGQAEPSTYPLVQRGVLTGKAVGLKIIAGGLTTGKVSRVRLGKSWSSVVGD